MGYGISAAFMMKMIKDDDQRLHNNCGRKKKRSDTIVLVQAI